MKIYPPKNGLKLLLAILLFVSTLLILFFERTDVKSKAQLETKQNKFYLTFQLKNTDKTSAQKFLEALSLPADTFEKLEFELDATSAAKLSYLSPQTIELGFQQGKLSFNAKSDPSLSHKEFTPFANLKIPKSSTILVISDSFTSILKNKYNLPEPTTNWLNENLAGEPQYFIVFGQNANFALFAKLATAPDFAKLATLDPDSYKEESDENVNYHLLKLSNRETTFAFIQIEDMTVMTSSKEAAKEIISTHKGASETEKFLENEKGPLSFALKIKGKEAVETNSIDFIVPNQTKVKSLLEKIKGINFIQKGNTFTGFVEPLES